MENLFFEAYKIRKVEQSLLDLFGKGLVGGTIHTCVGQEFTGIAVAQHLQKGDIVVSNHRCHGHYMAIYQDYEGLIAEILGKPEGVNRGFGGSQHIHREGFYSSGIQGGMVPNAAGMALSNKLDGKKNVSVSFIGDGTLGQGIIYETFNFISKHDIPHVIVVENNRYSQSTSQPETLSGSVEARATAFNINYFEGSTNEPSKLVETVGQAVSFAREKQRPAIVEIHTYRLNAHSKGDDDRCPEEVSNARSADSLNVFLQSATSDFQARLHEFDNYVDDIIEKMLNSEDSIDIKSEIRTTKASVLTEKKVELSNQPSTHTKEINTALKDIFKTNSSALYLGEDVKDPYGGAFKTTKGLTDENPGRVINMPISEPMITGVALGSATTQRLTFCEIMFGDFIALAADQILNHVSKMKNMFGKSLTTPLIIRTPMGGGRGYGATHSQCIEKHFLGIPGVNTFMFHPRVNSNRFYKNLSLELETPALVFEHKLLYSQDPNKKLPKEYDLYESEEKFPYSRLKTQEDADITVVALGGTGVLLERIIDDITEEEVYLDIFYPLNLNSKSLLSAISKSVQSTQKILFIEEGTPGYSIADGILSEVSQAIGATTTFSSRILTSEAMPIAASTYLEKQILPQSEDIEAYIWELFDE